MDEHGVLLQHLQRLKQLHVHGGEEHGKERPWLGHNPDNPDTRRVWQSACRFGCTGRQEDKLYLLQENTA